MIFPRFPGEEHVSLSLVARLDARIKLVLLGGMLAAVFSTAEVWRLSVLTLVALGIAFAAKISLARIFFRIHALRWVLVAGLLLHLLYGSGRTLMGVSFLSLDGLETGALVSWRLALAVICSSLFCWSTPVPVLMTAMYRLAGPVRKFAVVQSFGRHLALVLLWIPLVQEEMLVFLRQRKEGGRPLMGQVDGLLQRLLEVADSMVGSVSGGGEDARGGAVLPDHRIGLSDICVMFAFLILGLFWFRGLS